jgi:hypothetical protein
MRQAIGIDEGQIAAPNDAAQHDIEQNQHDARCRVCGPRPFLPSASTSFSCFSHYTKVAHDVTAKLTLGG